MNSGKIPPKIPKTPILNGRSPVAALAAAPRQVESTGLLNTYSMEAAKRAPTPMMNCQEFLEIRIFVVKEEDIFSPLTLSACLSKT